ncbi:hypothetical protein QQ020_01020 [Fulvivirgaceae bacterium BMA12]|uniref:Outer membrane protein beta-barrel domain-containing protein n=1 Tax=Agaribacillus aureus TaxID=3051825 RepID=A0ABT8KYP1_9BACT|nr:hypothetical protein [Fulvivirgaceae bacterium BMA12]
MKKIVTCILLSALLLPGQHLLIAQTTTDTLQNQQTGIFFYGGIGPAIPLGDFGDERESGFDLNTAIEYRFPSRFMLRGMFDFSNFRFNPGAITQNIDNQDFEVGGSNNLISLLVSGGYYFPLGRFTPYGFLGAGASFVSRPTVDLDLSGSVINIDQEVGAHFSHVVGVGVDFALNPLTEEEIADNKAKTVYIIYLESFYTGIPAITGLSSHKFNLLSLNVGIKTHF